MYAFNGEETVVRGVGEGSGEECFRNEVECGVRFVRDLMREKAEAVKILLIFCFYMSRALHKEV